MRETSFTAKLATLAIGESLILPDSKESRGPSRLEKATHLVKRVKGMETRQFRTRRMVAVDTGHPVACFPVLLIERLA